MMVFTSYVVVVVIGTSIAGKIDVFMISQKISLAGTGIFTIAYFIASFIEMPSRAIFQISTPFASEALKSNDMSALESLYKRVSINQLLIGGLLFILIWANVDNIFRIMPNGSMYENGKYVILFVGLAKVFDAATGINTSIVGNSKYYYTALIFIFILAGLAIINNIIFIPLYGITGAAMATAISIFLYNAIMVWFVWWKMKIHPFTKKTLLALFSLFIVLAINYFIHPFANAYIDIIIRSTIIAGAFGIIILVIKVSDEVNSTIFTTISKIINLWRK